MKTRLFTEIWKDIPGYIGLYQASTFGRIRALNYKRTKQIVILKQTKHKNGYYAVGLFKNNIHKTYKVHRLVWLTFKGEIPEGYEINHIDENKQNNCLSNLEYVTPSENCNHGTRNNRISLSSKHPKSKEHCANISKGRKGIVFSEEHKNNISIAKKKQCGRKVQCIETGEVFECVADAEKAVGLKKGSNIPKSCADNTKKSGGYRWRYV